MSNQLKGRRIAFLVANDGVEQIELTRPWDTLKDAGATVVLVAPEVGKVQGRHHLDAGDTFEADLAVADADASTFDALVLPGGVANPDDLRTRPDAVRLVRAFAEAGKPVAAICHAPWTLIVGGGLPLAAFGGRAEVLDRLAPVGDVYQAGTLSGNPLATAAGLSVLRRLRDPAVYEGLEQRAARLADGLAPCGRVQRVGALLTLFFHDGPVFDYRGAQAADAERYGALFRDLFAQGIYLAPSQFEAMFVSLAHGDEEIDRTVDAVRAFCE